jgi:Ca2+-binding RTX toxin-like protein
MSAASLNPSISDNGRYVVFESTATVLTDSQGGVLFPSFSDFDVKNPNNRGGVNNLYLKDTQTGVLTLVTGIFGDDNSIHGQISADNRYVVFQSAASNFVNNDSNGAYDIYIADLQAKTVKLISSDAIGTIGNKDSLQPSISLDGTFVAFASDSDNFLGFNDAVINVYATPWASKEESLIKNIKVAIDSNMNRDVFVKNISTGAIQLVSQNYKGGAANGLSDSPSISADGTKVVFRSFATNLISDLIDVARDGSSQVYLKDLKNSTLIQIDLLNGKLANGSSWSPKLSQDGNFVAFISDSTNLASNDQNNVADIFLKNLKTGELKIISDDSTGTGNVVDFAFSTDSSTLAYSRLSNLDDNATTNVYSLILNSGSPHIGELTISGKPAQGQKLTAISSIADSDGLGVFQYQWLSNNQALIGETNSEHIVTGNDIGKTLAVKVSYTDGKGNPESEISGSVFVPVVAPKPEMNILTLSVDIQDLDEDGQALATFTLTSDKPSESDIQIPFKLSGTALKDSDYQGTLTGTSVFVIPKGETTADLSFVANVDSLFEQDETVILTLSSPSNEYTILDNDQLVTIHNVIPPFQGKQTADKWIGTSNSDMAFGNDGNDTLSGGNGDDTIDGGNGNDSITGGKSVDELTGGSGKDTFIFKKGDSFNDIDVTDIITDLEKGDKIDLSGISKAFNFIKIVGTDSEWTGIKLTSKFDAYISNIDDNYYLVYETSSNGSSQEIIAIGSDIISMSTKSGIFTIL